MTYPSPHVPIPLDDRDDGDESLPPQCFEGEGEGDLPQFDGDRSAFGALASLIDYIETAVRWTVRDARQWLRDVMGRDG